MRFAIRVLAACWIVGTTAGIARAEMPSERDAFICVGVMATIFLLPLVGALVASIVLNNKTPKSPPHQQRKPPTTSENARDHP
jgi:hypothetical protein